MHTPAPFPTKMVHTAAAAVRAGTAAAVAPVAAEAGSVRQQVPTRPTRGNDGQHVVQQPTTLTCDQQHLHHQHKKHMWLMQKNDKNKVETTE